jgi:hypothetical protein
MAVEMVQEALEAGLAVVARRAADRAEAAQGAPQAVLVGLPAEMEVRRQVARLRAAVEAQDQVATALAGPMASMT